MRWTKIGQLLIPPKYDACTEVVSFQAFCSLEDSVTLQIIHTIITLLMRRGRRVEKPVYSGWVGDMLIGWVVCITPCLTSCVSVPRVCPAGWCREGRGYERTRLIFSLFFIDCLSNVTTSSLPYILHAHRVTRKYVHSFLDYLIPDNQSQSHNMACLSVYV